MEQARDDRPSHQDSKEVANLLITLGADLQQHVDRALGDIKGITYTEFRIVQAIDASSGGAASRVGLASAVQLTPSGVTRALRPLEKLGMVTTTRDERDARRSLAALTEQGRELLADAIGVIDDALVDHHGLRNLSAADTELLLDLLGRSGWVKR